MKSGARVFRTAGVVGLAVALFCSPLPGQAQELLPPPLLAPSPVPKCLETRYFKIILNRIADQDGIVRRSYYLFVTRYSIDGQIYEVIGNSHYIGAERVDELTYNKEEGLYYLKFRGLYSMCITAPFFNTITTPWDMEVFQKDYLTWFTQTYPQYSIPKMQNIPTPTPLVSL